MINGFGRPVGVIGFCFCKWGLWSNGQEGPAHPGFAFMQEVSVGLQFSLGSFPFPFPFASPASISEIFGVTHSNFS